MYTQVYDSSGAPVESETQMSSATRSISRSLTTGDTYYIRVRPYSNDYSGTYKIAFNASDTSPPNSIQLPSNAIPLTENQWADGSLPTSSDEQWFTFTATASTQYIHFSIGTASYIYVQVCDSNGAAVGNRTVLYYYTRNTSRSLTTDQTYYIRVSPYGTYTGTYQIGFTTSTTAPSFQLPSNAIPLIANQWADGNIPTSSDVQWFTFTATASPQFIHAAFGTLTYLSVQVYNSSGATVGSSTVISSSGDKYFSQTLTTGQPYYIKVWPNSSTDSGTYRIGFNTSTTSPPNAIQLPSNAIELTENQWANGNLPTSGDVQWFTFTATVPTQYIHFDNSGTLKIVYVQVYDSSGATVGSETVLSNSPSSVSRSLTTGDTYYIRVRPYGTRSGTYQIGFTTSATAPTS